MTENTVGATIRLPEQLTIANVAAVKQEADVALRQEGGISVDVAAMSGIDTAGVQFLLALGQHCKQEGRAITMGELQSAVVDFARGVGVEPARFAE